MSERTGLSRRGAWSAWQLQRREAAPVALAHVALRTKSEAALEALASLATGGRHTAAQVVLTPGAAMGPPEHVAALALALAGRASDEEELAAGASLYEHVWHQGALPTLSGVHHQGLGQSCFLAGRDALLRQALPDLTRLHPQVRHYLETDLAGRERLRPDAGHRPSPHQHGAHQQQAHEQWERLLSTFFVDAGLEPVRVSAPSPDRPAPTQLFDHLTTGESVGGPVAASVTGGPLVTVIMPCYRPDEGLLTSVASLRDQSWADLEILVVDDHSGPDYDDIFAQALALDERARLIRMERNGGSYLARNAALSQAQGEFIAFQDADDWSHPRRIEHQASLLLAEPTAPASLSQAVRARDDLTHQWFGYRVIRDNASSLMARREVMEQVGPFVEIRKSADSEYAERLTTLVGEIANTGTPLAITRLRSGSLSRGDFTYQWAAPDRMAFKGSYRAWHRRLRAEGAGIAGPGHDGAGHDGAGLDRAVLDRAEGPGPGLADRLTGPALVPGQPVPFPVPRSFLRGLPLAPDWERLAVAFAGDFSEEPATPGAVPHARAVDHAVARAAEPVAALAEATGPVVEGAGVSERVGLWHLESVPPVRTKRAEMHDGWFDRVAASNGRLVPLTRQEDVTIERLVVLDPRVLLLTGDQPCQVRVEAVDVWLTPEVVTPDDTSLPVDLLEVSDVCHGWWGLRPLWVAAPHLSNPEREALTHALPGMVTAAD